MYYRVGLFFVFLAFLPALQGQPALPVTWGEVPQEHLELTQYESDPDAGVLILGDYGSFHHKESRGVIYTRHVRIKILTEAGLEWADQELRIRDKIEKLKNIQAQTINYTHGKIEAFELGKEDFHVEELAEYGEVVKFFLTNVRVGSIIEFRYEIVKKGKLLFPEWYFQHEVPVLESVLRTSLDFNTNHTQYKLSGIASNQVVYNKWGFHEWKAKNLPGLIDEPYVPTLSDYVTRIRFASNPMGATSASVISIQIISPEEMRRKLEAMNQKKLDSTDSPVTSFATRELIKGIGKELDWNFEKDDIFRVHLSKLKQKEIAWDTLPELAKAHAIYDYVQQFMTWDEQLSFFSFRPLQEVCESTKGNSAEINLVLLKILLMAKLEAHPIWLSTRENGKLQNGYSFVPQLNHLIVKLNIEGKDYFLDATDKLRPFGEVNSQSANVRGLLVVRPVILWIDIPAPSTSIRKQRARLSLQENGALQGKMREELSGYYALEVRKDKEKLSEPDFWEDYLPERLVAGADTEPTLENVEEINKPLKLTYPISTDEFSVFSGDMLYLNPMLVFDQDKNPFLSPKRKFPIDFGYPITRDYMLMLTLPKGYEPVSLPKNVKVSFEDQSVEFEFSCQMLGNMLQLVSKFSMRDTQFPAEMHVRFRELFDKIAQKHGEQIVLKKNASHK